MKSGANIVKFPDHIVHCLINTKRPDLKPLQQVLLGAEEGEESNLFFVTKGDRENLKKVLTAIDNHPYMVLMGGVIEDECYTPRGVLEWAKLSLEKEMGQVLGLMSSPAQTLVSMLENSGSSELVRILDQSSRGTTDLLGQYLNDNASDDA
ncbi:Oidioi.mRNA.OKI2018_I69.XSR.g16334.t1.cds [Oikopleura dioica]|uniref:Oidioi.mRNA.OKI2018_I69.XSR.g16334.t1.cds n=1 Tax=Oikopleura dioica TaxID=34765 RepID=A0ABN7SFR6_OIKDI|nr:Oidioi.mRNA.OKI2018_I69.XSR.g16334.t1.cds [Oikopleura dioica]